MHFSLQRDSQADLIFCNVKENYWSLRKMIHACENIKMIFMAHNFGATATYERSEYIVSLAYYLYDHALQPCACITVNCTLSLLDYMFWITGWVSPESLKEKCFVYD